MDNSPLGRFKQTRWYRRAIWAGVVLVIYTIVGFLILPAVIKSQLLQRLPAITKRQVAIDQIKLNPYSLSFTMRGFTLTETNGEKFAGVGELYVNFELSSVFHGAWTFGEVSVKDPFIQVTRLADGKFNFENLIPPPSSNAPAPGSMALPAVLVELFSVEGGTVAFTDLQRPEPFHTKLTPIRLNLTQLTTRRDKNSPYAFDASDDGGMKLSWEGYVGVQPPSSSGKLKIEGVSLPKYAAYASDFFSGKITQGKVAVEGQYQMALGSKGPELSLTNGLVQVRHLEIKSPSGEETLLTLPSADVRSIVADLGSRSAHVQQVATADLSLLARREANGTINWLNLIKLPVASTNVPASGAVSNAAPWTVSVAQVSVTNYTVQFEDLTLKKPAKLKVDQLAAEVKGFSTAGDVPVDVSTSLRLNEAGTVKVTGPVHLLAPAGEVQVTVKDLALAPFQPYVEPLVNLAIRDGRLSVEGKAQFALVPGGMPKAHFTGNVGLADFATVDGHEFKDFVKWQSLAVSDIDLTTVPQALQIGEVRLKGLQTSLSVGADKQVNLLTVLGIKTPEVTTDAKAPVTAPAPVATTNKTAIPPISLKSFVLEGASLHFADESLQPNCHFAVQQFDVKVDGLSTISDKPADISISGRIDELAPFSITGSLRPVLTNLLVDLVISNKNMDLTSFTPYMEKFGGYPLVKGKLSVGLKYEIQGMALKAEHSVLVDQFTLGAKNNSPDALHLPLKLAVALLKDRHGKIELDLPVTGRLDDPKFSVFPVVVQVLVNLLTKAIASPFALLGKLVGGGEEMSFVAFNPGLADVPAAEQEKMGKLAKALAERPGLNLEIAGSADLAADRQALAKAHFENDLKTARIKEIAAAGGTPPALSELTLEAPDRERLVKALYVAAFGPLETTNAVSTNASAAASSTMAAPSTQPTSTKPVSSAKPVAAATAKRFQRSVTGGKGGEIMLSLFDRPTNAPRKPVASKPSGTSAKASTQSSKTKQPAAAPTSAVSAAAGSAATPVVPEITLAEMEDKLAGRIKISDEEVRQLMQRRAQSVQAYLQNNGKVEPERLFIVAPKAIDESFRGETKVNLLLN